MFFSTLTALGLLDALESFFPFLHTTLFSHSIFAQPPGLLGGDSPSPLHTSACRQPSPRQGHSILSHLQLSCAATKAILILPGLPSSQAALPQRHLWDLTPGIKLNFRAISKGLSSQRTVSTQILNTTVIPSHNL